MTETAKPKFAERSFGVASFKYNRWSLDLAEAHTLEDALNDTSLWSNIVNQIAGHDKTKGRGDVVEVRKADTGLYAELLIVEIGPGYVKAEPIRAYEPKVPEVPEGVPFVTKWNVGKRTHDVVRKADGQVMVGGFQTKVKAIEWITDHMSKMAA